MTVVSAIWMPLQVFRDEDLPGLAPLAVLDDQGGLTVAQETVFHPEGSNLGDAETGGEKRVEEHPLADGATIASVFENAIDSGFTT